MKKNYCVCISLILLFFGCKTNKGIFTDNEVFVESFPEEYTLDGQLFLEEYGVLDIAYVNDKIVLITPERESVFSVYNTEGEFLNNFGAIGRGPNEILGVDYNGINSYGIESVSFWVNDVNARRLVEINLPKSVEKGAIVFDMDLKYPYSRAVNAIPLSGSVVVLEQETPHNMELFTCDLNERKEISEKLFRYDVDKPFAVYRSTWIKHPEKNILAGAMYGINQVNFIFLPDGERKSTVFHKGSRDVERVYNDETMMMRYKYFVSIRVTSDYMYALNMDQIKEDSYRVPKPVDIYVLDWDGNAVARFIIPDYLFCFAVDEKNGYIYGVVDDERVYRYGIPKEFLHGIKR